MAARLFLALGIASAMALVGACGEHADESGTAALPELDSNEVERLRALGYAEVGDPLKPGDRTGVVVHDRDRAAAGLNLFTNAKPCSAQLIDMDGAVLHEWSYKPCLTWANAVLLPDGDLVVAGRVPDRLNDGSREDSRFLLRLAWDGSLRWKRELAVHHDLDRTPDGLLHSLAYAPLEQRPDIASNVPVRNDSLLLLSDEGIRLDEVSMWDFFQASPDVATLKPVKKKRTSEGEEVDLFHLNSIEWIRFPELAEQDAIYSAGNILVCIRNQDAVVILDWSARRIVWSWGEGQLSGPHDATLLASGNVLIFDNGLGRKWSRVLEVDPRTGGIVWEYRAANPKDFYTPTRGAAQRLGNGNTLITESDNGVAFEVTSAGETVWRFQNPQLTKRREPSIIVRTRRFEGMSFDDLKRAVASRDASRTRVD